MAAEGNGPEAAGFLVVPRSVVLKTLGRRAGTCLGHKLVTYGSLPTRSLFRKALCLGSQRYGSPHHYMGGGARICLTGKATLQLICSSGKGAERSAPTLQGRSFC